MGNAKFKLRVDQLLVNRGLADSLKQAQALLMAGEVLINDVPVAKAGVTINPDSAVVRLRTQSGRYVSRAGDKLAFAHARLRFDVAGKVALDVGISTGGFTDFLIQNGARTVFGVDVGYGQVAMSLQQNSNVVILERLNARLLTPDSFREAVAKKSGDKLSDSEHISLVVMDLSFISVLSVLPAIQALIASPAELVVMIKPQFEATKSEIGEGGIVRDLETREAIVTRVVTGILDLGFTLLDRADSELAGTKGNLEHFVWLKLG